jgi:hypothetical protein
MVGLIIYGLLNGSTAEPTEATGWGTTWWALMFVYLAVVRLSNFELFNFVWVYVLSFQCRMLCWVWLLCVWEALVDGIGGWRLQGRQCSASCLSSCRRFGVGRLVLHRDVMSRLILHILPEPVPFPVGQHT